MDNEPKKNGKEGKRREVEEKEEGVKGRRGEEEEEEGDETQRQATGGQVAAGGPSRPASRSPPPTQGNSSRESGRRHLATASEAGERRRAGECRAGGQRAKGVRWRWTNKCSIKYFYFRPINGPSPYTPTALPLPPPLCLVYSSLRLLSSPYPCLRKHCTI